jgi:hypothetical protein
MIVGCKLPAGFTIEVGTPGEDGYRYYTIPGAKGKKPGTLEIPTPVGERWFRDNAKLRYVVDGALYKSK